MGSRAECVMLNKGPYIRETLRFLVDVLGRMEEHQHNMSSRLRKLRVSDVRRSRTRRSAAREAGEEQGEDPRRDDALRQLINGGPGWIRTSDQGIMSPLL
jgi:hypothetical protein